MSTAFCIRPVVALRIFFSVVMAGMLWVTVRATLDYSLTEVGASIGADPWFHATLADAYFGFLTFYCWVFYLERTAGRRALWFVAILILGNIAMAAYALDRLFRLPADAGAADILLRRKGGAR